MPSRIKVGGTWRNVTMPYTKVAGVWKPAKAGYTKVAGVWRNWWLQGGINDASFATYDTTNRASLIVGNVSSSPGIVVQSDGKILVGGNFTTWNGLTVGRLVRLNTDGSLDTNFITNTGTGAATNVNTIAVQSDGKILVGGNFTTWNGVAVGRLVRLNANGSLDTTFTTNTGTGGSGGAVNTVAVQSNGQILVGGLFSTWNGVTVGKLVGLNADGSLDTTFTTNIGIGSAAVNTIAVQSDGKILVGGAFATWNGVTVNYIVRLNADGTRDTAFTTNTGTGASAAVSAIAVQSDGKILVGGNFTTWNGVAVGRLVRLNANGTRDTTFTTNTGTGGSAGVNTVAVQSNGQILVGGAFVTWNGATVNFIVRLNADGTRDTAFTTNTGTGASSSVYAIAVQSDGKILVGGAFVNWNNVYVGYIVRINNNGTNPTSSGIDGAAIISANNSVSSIAVQSNGQLLIGGAFTTWNGVTVNRIVRLNADGTRDTAFTTNAGTATGTATSSIVQTVAVQSDGKILVGGAFTTWNGTTVGYIVRLNSDGTRDTAFTTNTGTGAAATINTVAVQSNGQILVGGNFVTWNGATVNSIVRLNADGTRDTAFTTNIGGGGSGINTIAVQSDGKILVGGAFNTWNGTTVGYIVRLNANGTRDTTFTTNTGTGANLNVSTIAVQSDGKILVGGLFSSWNGVTVNRIVRLNSDGTRDTAFTTNAGTGANSAVSAIVLQSDSKIVVGGVFTTWNGTTVNRIVRLNADGTRETAFTTNANVGFNNNVQSVLLQSDGKILVGGVFTAFSNANRSYLARIGGEIAL